MLKVQDLQVATETKEILHGVSIEVKAGETVVLLGPNGAGKSTLAGAVMGMPGLRVTGGKMIFDGVDITEMPVDERAKQGIFMAWQAPVEIPGVSVLEMLRAANDTRVRVGSARRHGRAALPLGRDLREAPSIHQQLATYTKTLELSPFILQRELNVGLSGGEKKKLEILQMMALGPKLAILDETDSGLDVDAARAVSRAVRDYQKEQGTALLIVTHNARILQELKVDKVYVLVEGRVAKTGDGELIEKIEKDGFKGMKLVTEDASEEEG